MDQICNRTHFSALAHYNESGDWVSTAVKNPLASDLFFLVFRKLIVTVLFFLFLFFFPEYLKCLKMGSWISISSTSLYANRKMRILSVVEFLTGLCLRCFLFFWEFALGFVVSYLSSHLISFLDSTASWLFWDLYNVIQVSFHTFHYKG